MCVDFFLSKSDFVVIRIPIQMAGYQSPNSPSHTKTVYNYKCNYQKIFEHADRYMVLADLKTSCCQRGD